MNAFRKLCCSLTLALALSGAAIAGGWESFSSDDYGYSMLVPTGGQVATKEWPGGWGGLVSTYQGVTVYGLAKLGAQESPEAIERFAVEATGIPAGAWGQFAEGSDKGWQGYKAVKAEHGSRLLFGGYGIGPKGSYLILMETTVEDFVAHEADYEAWYESVQLH